MNNDTLKARGFIALNLMDAVTGKLIETVEFENLIVDLGKQNMTKLIAGASGDYAITKIGFGTGTSPASAGDVSLTTPFVKGIESYSYPSSTSIAFLFSLLATEGNGMAITELGLYSNNGDLFSRKVRAAINKDSSFYINGSWTIVF